MRAILRSGDPRAGEVAALMQRELDAASGPADEDARAQITGFYRTLLAQRSADPAALTAFLSSAASRVLNRLQLTMMATAIPGAAPLVAAGQMVHSLYQRNWTSVAAALPSLAALLPSLRHWDEVEQLIQSLPADIRSGLEALHGWIESTDEALLPQLDIRQAGPALAVAVLLWQVQKALPPPSQALQGVGRFVAGLPGYWQTLVGMNSVGGSLLAHVVKPDGPDLSADKVRPTPQQKKALVEHQRAVDQRHAIVPAWQDTDVELADWMVPGQPQRGGAIAALPEAGEAQQHHDAATSPASRVGFAASLIAWVPLLNRAADFVQLPQAPPSVEMQLMGESALHDVLPTEPLIQPPPMLATAGSAGAVRSFASRYPRTVTAAVATGVAAAAGGVVALAWYLWGRNTDAPTLEALVDLAAMRIEKAPDGAWRSELDRLEQTLDASGAEESALDDGLRAGRVRRDASQSTSTAAPPAVLTLHEQIHVMRLWSLAVAADIARQPGWEWVAQAPASEQELLVTHWHALRQEQAKLVELDTIPGAALTAALQSHGWTAGWDDIEVRLPSTQAAGVTVDDRMPLLEYCLARSASADATFLRGNVPLSGPELHQLSRFVASEGCKGLRAQVDARVETLRPALEAAVKATLVIHALRAKAQGSLGGGGEHLAGADIVLGFLQGAPEVTSSPLTYVDRLVDGSEVRIAVPNYLVLRSDRNHQVVLYRSDLSTFQAFKDEGGFRQFLDTRRAKAGMFVDHQRVDQTLADDIVHATAPHQQAAVRERVQAWEPRLTLFQTKPRHPDAWNPQDSFVLDFAASSTGLQDWAARLVHYRQGLEQQRLDQGDLRWSPLGIANSAAEAAFQRSLDQDLQSLDRHAKPAVTEALKRALRMAGYRTSLEGFDPDTILLRQGGREMSLTAWATTGWQAGALHRPLLTIDPDAPGHLPNVRVDPDPWPSSEDIAAMSFHLQPTGNSTARGADAEWTGLLRDEDALRALCGVLEDFSGSNRLAADYKDHLNALLGRSQRDDSTAGVRLVSATGNQIRLRTRWMIEKAYTDGAIDTATHQALIRAHANIDPVGGQPSSLQSVTLAGKPITGLWAMQAGSTTHVFLPDTENGDRLLTAEAFKAWLEENTDSRSAYIIARTLYRHHDAVNTAFDRKTTAAGIPVGFTVTRGPDDAARVLIEGRIKDVHEITKTPLEQVADSLKLIGAIAVAAACSAATGGAGAALCVAGSLALVAEGIRKGVDLLERGNVDGAIEALGESMLDAADVLQVTAIPALLFRLGRRTLNGVEDAVGALRQWRAQGHAFGADGVVNRGFAVSRDALPDLPMLSRPLPGGGTLHEQGGRHFLMQEGAMVEVYTDSEGVRRLRDPNAPDTVGAPVEFRDGQWRNRKERSAGRGATTPHNRPPSPDWAVNDLKKAEGLPPERHDELEAIFGRLTLETSVTADVRAVVDGDLMRQRIQQILADPTALGAAGDEAMILRAWADSAVLGNGKGVETYTIEVGDWTRVARFGLGPVGLHVQVKDARSLPTLDDLVAAADVEALLQRLGLPANTDDVTLLQAVRVELAETIKIRPDQSLLTWQRWIAMQHRLPTAADNLLKHFPALTKAEAEELAARAGPQLKQQLESWVFPTEIQTAVANTLASRTQRQQREAVLRGNVQTLAEVNELGIHLQQVLPGRRISVQEAGNGGIALVLVPSSPTSTETRLVFVGSPGRTITDGDGNLHANWQDGLFDQLTDAEKSSLGAPGGTPAKPDDLRRAVVEQMKHAPIATACRWPRPVGGKAKRADDCAPPPSISLSPDEIRARDDVSASLDQSHQKAEQAYRRIHSLLLESEALKQRKRDLAAEGLSLTPAESSRLAELARMDLMHEKNFRMKNFVAYRMDEIAFDGTPLELGPMLPLQGAAYSGPPLSWFGKGDYIGDVPIRRVFIRDEEVEKSYKGKGKQRTETPIAPNDRFRTDYAMGADLLITSSARARTSGAVELVDEDLKVRVPTAEGGAAGHWVALASLDDAGIEALGTEDLSDTLKTLLGDAKLLPSNARALTPGTYRVFEIRSCSEGKVLDTWFDAMVSANPRLADALHAPANTPVPGLAGGMTLVSDMHPCATSCDRRLTALMKVLPNMNIRVYYHFLDNAERTDWRVTLMVKREMERTRAQWDAAGRSADEVRDAIRATLLDKANPGAREAAEEQLRLTPPRAEDLPAARLWQPEVEEEQGL